MPDFDINSGETSADIEVQGENTRKRMKAILDAITPGMSGEVTYMSVEIQTTPNGNDDEELPSPTQNVDSDTGPEEAVGKKKGGGKVGKMEEVPERSKPKKTGGHERLTEADREDGTFRKGSSHHVIASMLHENGEMRPAEIVNALDEMPEGTAGGAIHQLWQRRLADRSEQDHKPGDGGSVSTYWLSERGEDLIEEMGTVTEAEWADS